MEPAGPAGSKSVEITKPMLLVFTILLKNYCAACSLRSENPNGLPAGGAHRATQRAITGYTVHTVHADKY